MKKSYSVKIYLNVGKNKTSTVGKIYVRILVDRVAAEFSTTHRLNANEWDSEKEFSKKNKLLNEDLVRIRSRINDTFRSLELQNKVITSKLIRDTYLGKNEVATGLVAYYSEHLSIITQDKSLSEGTKKSYRRAYNKVLAFLAFKKWEKITLKEIDLAFIQAFDDYLSSLTSEQYKKPLEKSYISRLHELFKVLLNKAFEYELIPRNPYNKFKIKRESAKEHVFLTWDEMQLMTIHTLGDNKHLQKVRDLFLFSCYTGGLRYSDLSSLQISDFQKIGKRIWIVKVQEKTKQTVRIPLFAPAIELYEKYKKLHKSNPMNLFFDDFPNNAELNISIKVVAKLVGIEKHLTWHVSRHTFATTVSLGFNSGNLEDTSKLLGHKDIKTTQIYAEVATERLSEVADSFDKKYSEMKKKR